jgi:hypothetical protein
MAFLIQLSYFLVFIMGISSRNVATEYNFSQAEIDSGEALGQLNKEAVANALARLKDGAACNKNNVRVRREW